MFAVTPDEITGYRTLTWIRCLGRCEGESILNAAGRTPILDTALRRSFRKLAEEPNVELVFSGFVVAPPSAATRVWTRDLFVALDEPGYAKTAMNFRLEPAGAGRVRLTTETRVLATDLPTRTALAINWRTILPESDLIRRAWLRAIARRATT